MKRREKPRRPKLQRRERVVPGHRAYPARRLVCVLEPGRPEIVEVHVSRTRRDMRDTVARFRGGRENRLTEGMVISYFKTRIHGRPPVRMGGHIVARMFLNRIDLARRPGELIAHESGHAAMAWARIRRANLSQMEGEEVMCHALGRLTQEITNRLWGMGWL